MKVYVAMQAVPWEDVQIQIEERTIQMNSDTVKAGYMPLFWSEEAARTAHPNAEIVSGDVPDDWHPFLRLGKPSPEVVVGVVEVSAEEAGV